MGGSGGGGGSGKHEWPGYMQLRHEEWITEVDLNMGTAIAANPYSAANAFDPATYLTDMGTKLSALITAQTTITDPGFATLVTDTTNGFIKKVAAAIDAAALSGTWITTQTTALINDLVANNAALVGIFEGGMTNINAGLTSAHVSGAYRIAADIVREGGKAETEIRKILAHDRALAITQLSSDLLANHRQWLDIYKGIVAIAIDIDRLSIVAKAEQSEMNLKIDVASQTFPIEVYQMGGTILGSIGGGGVVQSAGKPPSKEQSALAGAVAGASLGATVGGGYGAAIGAVVGGIAGYLSG